MNISFKIPNIVMKCLEVDIYIMIVWGADVSSSHKEYQNIVKDYQQNLVICSCTGVEITWNFKLFT